MEKCRTYALTIRPLNGIDDDQITMVTRYIKRQSEYYHVVTEKTGVSRHLHAGLILKTPKSRSNFVTDVLRMFKNLSPSEKSVLRSGIKIMYNFDFINVYLNKDDDTVVLESCLPEAGHIESFFPPKPLPKSQAREKKCSLYYHELEALWFKHVAPGTELNTIEARRFLSKMMYSERCIPVIRDDKMIIQTARHLVRWLAKTEDDVWELAPFEKEESY